MDRLSDKELSKIADYIRAYIEDAQSYYDRVKRLNLSGEIYPALKRMQEAEEILSKINDILIER